jgi:hypothetical protein
MTVHNAIRAKIDCLDSDVHALGDEMDVLTECGAAFAVIDEVDDRRSDLIWEIEWLQTLLHLSETDAIVEYLDPPTNPRTMDGTKVVDLAAFECAKRRAKAGDSRPGVAWVPRAGV